jgi:hypothetical protein
MNATERLHHIAFRLASAAVANTGLPNDEANARALAGQSYLAARMLLDIGAHVEASMFGAKKGGDKNE